VPARVQSLQSPGADLAADLWWLLLVGSVSQPLPVYPGHLDSYKEVIHLGHHDHRHSTMQGSRAAREQSGYSRLLV